MHRDGNDEQKERRCHDWQGTGGEFGHLREPIPGQRDIDGAWSALFVGGCGIGYPLIELRAPVAVTESADVNEDRFVAGSRRDIAKSFFVVPGGYFSFAAHGACLFMLVISEWH